MRNRIWMFAPTALAVLPFVSACSGDIGPQIPLPSIYDDEQTPTASAKDAGTSQGGSGTGGADASQTGSTSGLPCDIGALLAQRCDTCHGTRLIGGAPMALLTYGDLTSPSPSDAQKTNAQRSLEMMQAGTMPPGGGLASTEVALFAAWLKSGPAQGSCGTSLGDGATTSDPYGTAVTCTSDKYWIFGDRESPLMHPGGTCISCHQSDEGPSFAVAGTVYASAHEPDDCNGVSIRGLSVVITDARGVNHTLTTNAVGNFFASANIAKPYTAKLVFEGRTRAMASAQSNGDCNACHTEAGKSGAPGRLMLP